MPGYKISLYAPAVHLMIWVILLLIPAIIFHDTPVGPGLSGAFFLLTTLYHIGLFYANAYFLFPRLMTRTRWPLYAGALACILAGSYYGKWHLLQAWKPDIHLTTFLRRFLFFPPIPFLLASILFRMVGEYIRRDREAKDRKAERLTAELKFLRQQISPHFLFNMMTNMVSLARQGSSVLEASLIKLSDLLRYSLYESGEEKILLSRELQLLQDYIDLCQLRFGADVDMRLFISEPAPEGMIEPMLLVPFVENAFKHGIGMVRHPFIHVGIKMDGAILSFQVRNNYDASRPKGVGIGLVNIRSRLRLLYPGKHQLTITDKDEIYTVELNIDLSC